MNARQISNICSHSLLVTFFGICFSLVSFSQDTIQLFKQKKKVKKDAVEEIQAQPESNKGTIRYIKYGTSTGSCVGYCSYEAVIDSVSTVKITSSLPADPARPSKMDTSETSEAHWNMLVGSVQVNSFFEIPKKVGTPGANGGVFEWIEIKYAGRIHKVTFDHTGPEEYEGLKNLEKLLKLMTGF